MYMMDGNVQLVLSHLSLYHVRIGTSVSLSKLELCISSLNEMVMKYLCEFLPMPFNGYQYVRTFFKLLHHLDEQAGSNAINKFS
jgi:hypothetical protein